MMCSSPAGAGKEHDAPISQTPGVCGETRLGLASCRTWLCCAGHLAVQRRILKAALQLTSLLLSGSHAPSHMHAVAVLGSFTQSVSQAHTSNTNTKDIGYMSLTHCIGSCSFTVSHTRCLSPSHPCLHAPLFLLPRLLSGIGGSLKEQGCVLFPLFTVSHSLLVCTICFDVLLLLPLFRAQFPPLKEQHELVWLSKKHVSVPRIHQTCLHLQVHEGFALEPGLFGCIRKRCSQHVPGSHASA